ncbi:class F sortase [Geodermatophilus sp. SYSU D00691]
MRPAAVVAVLGTVLAVGIPAAWALTRPDAAAGAPVAEALRTPPAPSESPVPGAPAAPAVTLPPVTVRDAAPARDSAVPAPVRLTVPSLGIDAPVEPVGVAPDGQMQIPDDVARAGWYRFGPAPGGAGNAVLAGHVDDAEQGLGALAPLREAAPGTEVVVTDAAGTTTRWRVVSRELISKQQLPLAELFARDGAPRLVLVTCGGPFDPGSRSYRDNVVVVAEPVA